MSKLDPNTIIGILQGKLGDLVFVRQPNGTITVRRPPVRKADFKPGELVTQNAFKGALAYVTWLKQQADHYAAYQAAAKLEGKRACDLANADFRQHPKLHDIDLSGYSGRPAELIAVEAVDDFGVAEVLVSITGLGGEFLENGAAVFDPVAARWIYTTTAILPLSQTVIVHVTAVDRPGNVVFKSVHHAISGAS